jgi:hypothetical protein
MRAVQRAIREAKGEGYRPGEASVFLDRAFWHALGKARDWDRGVGAGRNVLLSAWLRKWHDFIDHLATGGTIEAFFERLER